MDTVGEGGVVGAGGRNIVAGLEEESPEGRFFSCGVHSGRWRVAGWLCRLWVCRWGLG